MYIDQSPQKKLFTASDFGHYCPHDALGVLTRATSRGQQFHNVSYEIGSSECVTALVLFKIYHKYRVIAKDMSEYLHLLVRK